MLRCGTSFFGSYFGRLRNEGKAGHSIAATDPPSGSAANRHNKNVNIIYVLRGSDMGLKYYTQC